MTREDFRQERALLLQHYGEAPGEAATMRAQAFAKLYARSGWTQEQLAHEEHKTQRWMSYQIVFGEFLLRTDSSKTKELKEFRFRGWWKSTAQTQTTAQRYVQVEEMLDEAQQEPPIPTKRGSKRLAQQILEHFADSRWHNLSVIYKRLEATPKTIHTVLDGMRLRGTFHTFCERRRASKDEGGWQYRFVKHHGQRISYGVLVTELAPIVKGLKEQGQKNMATMSPGSVAILAHELEKVLEKLAQ
jgi:hypothetical protein